MAARLRFRLGDVRAGVAVRIVAGGAGIVTAA
jgi:hypothetical protein